MPLEGRDPRGGRGRRDGTKGEPRGWAAEVEAARPARLSPPPPASLAASRRTLLPSRRPSLRGGSAGKPIPRQSLTSARQRGATPAFAARVALPVPPGPGQPAASGRPCPREPSTGSPGPGRQPGTARHGPRRRPTALPARHWAQETRRAAPTAGAAAGRGRGAEAGEGGALRSREGTRRGACGRLPGRRPRGCGRRPGPPWGVRARRGQVEGSEQSRLGGEKTGAGGHFVAGYNRVGGGGGGERRSCRSEETVLSSSVDNVFGVRTAFFLGWLTSPLKQT